MSGIKAGDTWNVRDGEPPAEVTVLRDGKSTRIPYLHRTSGGWRWAAAPAKEWGASTNSYPWPFYSAGEDDYFELTVVAVR